jgi:transposase
VAVVRQTRTTAPKPTANLRYLDLAVLLELWRETGLGEVLEDLLPIGEAAVRPASVVAALTLQRCVDPASKLQATRWLPRTALPELLDVTPAAFNNTRLHRVLAELDDATPALMAKLPSHYIARDGRFAALFIDTSDTWFVGEGPSMSRVGKTKEGRLERKIGILLLCNEHGYPLRWEVFEGTQHDSIPMLRTFKAVAGLRWATEVPIVCDRAMGHTAEIQAMVDTGLQFLTALTCTEFDAYAPTLPHNAFAELDSSAEVKAVAQCAEKAGLHRVRDDLYVLDLGIVERADGVARPTGSVQNVVVEAMRLCREIHEALAHKRFASQAAAGRSLGLRKSVTTKYCALSALSEQQQREVLDGKVRAPLARLLEVAALKDKARRDEAFDALLHSSPSKPLRTRASVADPPAAASPSLRVRVVAYFNPDRFVFERQRAREQLQAIEAFAKQLNAKLQAPRSRQTRRSIAAQVDRRLRQEALLEAFEVRIHEGSDDASSPLCVDLVLDQAEWERRRRYDGFTVLVSHPDLPHAPAELCSLYRAKDAVEKDFGVIKSVVDLRPIRHRDDGKVRAHVTLCMLALLLERTLRRRLAKHGASAEMAIETLATCHLNVFKGERGPAAYAITQLDDDQRALLRSLRMLHLADDGALADKITAR